MECGVLRWKAFCVMVCWRETTLPSARLRLQQATTQPPDDERFNVRIALRSPCSFLSVFFSCTVYKPMIHVSSVYVPSTVWWCITADSSRS